MDKMGSQRNMNDEADIRIKMGANRQDFISDAQDWLQNANSCINEVKHKPCSPFQRSVLNTGYPRHRRQGNRDREGGFLTIGA